MKSEPVEGFQRSSLTPPFEVYSPSRVPSEFQLKRYTPHISSQGVYHLRNYMGVPQNILMKSIPHAEFL